MVPVHFCQVKMEPTLSPRQGNWCAGLRMGGGGGGGVVRVFNVVRDRETKKSTYRLKNAGHQYITYLACHLPPAQNQRPLRSKPAESIRRADSNPLNPESSLPILRTGVSGHVIGICQFHARVTAPSPNELTTRSLACPPKRLTCLREAHQTYFVLAQLSRSVGEGV